jgi:RNA polymerase sigma factor (sigma-70 family)
MKKISFRNDILPMKDTLFRLALRITLSREEAEDIVQDTLIKVWNRRESWDTIDNIEAFSLTICRNMALDRLRLHDNQNTSLDDNVGGERLDTTSNPFERTVQREKVEIVRNLIDSLPEKQRSCMQLRDIEGKTYKEIAAVLGITEEQVKVNIFRASLSAVNTNRPSSVISHCTHTRLWQPSIRFCSVLYLASSGSNSPPRSINNWYLSIQSVKS